MKEGMTEHLNGMPYAEGGADDCLLHAALLTSTIAECKALREATSKYYEYSIG